MCIALPQKVQKVVRNVAYVGDKKSRRVKIGFSGVVQKGDWVLVNADLAIGKVTGKEASEIKELFKSN